MQHLSLFTINYVRPPRSPAGGLVKDFIVGEDDRVGDGIPDRTRYADMRAHYWVWKNKPRLDIVGFQHYRKHFNFRGDTVGWAEVSLPMFRDYQDWLRCWDGATAIDLLAEHDILVTPPFDVSYNGNTAEDYKLTRSPADWEVLAEALYRRGYTDLTEQQITCHNMFMAPAHIFRGYMQFWWDLCREIEPAIKTLDAKKDDTPARAMAFLSERIFSLWLHSAKLKVKTIPLLICWGAR
jgi:hypothetical protein